MIPIFRGKKIGLNNSYIIGFYQQYIEGFQDNIFHEINNTLIDPTTLAIHFPDMLDSQGNKIFASLSEDGKGGDICYVRDFSYGDLQGVARYEDNCFRIHRKGKAMGISLKCRDIKVIGIQE